MFWLGFVSGIAVTLAIGLFIGWRDEKNHPPVFHPD